MPGTTSRDRPCGQEPTLSPRGAPDFDRAGKYYFHLCRWWLGKTADCLASMRLNNVQGPISAALLLKAEQKAEQEQCSAC